MRLRRLSVAVVSACLWLPLAACAQDAENRPPQVPEPLSLRGLEDAVKQLADGLKKVSNIDVNIHVDVNVVFCFAAVAFVAFAAMTIFARRASPREDR